MIHVENVTKRYGSVTVVDDVSFDVADGEAVALWGPNGVGKSTLVKCILGFASFEGTIEVDGLDVRSRPKASRSRIGHVPQELAYYPDLTVGETLSYSAELRGVSDDKAIDSLDLVGLVDERPKQVGALSGGMKQRLALALALMHDPPVLLLDEPTSNLDVASRESIVGLLEELRDGTRCVLLTSHHLEEVGMLVDRVLAMEAGSVMLETDPGSLADKLGLRSWLHLTMPESQTDRAIEVLDQDGFAARMNSRGILVEVSAQGKGEALAVLNREGLDVLDLEVWR